MVERTSRPSSCGLADQLRRAKLRLAAISDHLHLASDFVENDTRLSDRLDLIDIRELIDKTIATLEN